MDTTKLKKFVQGARRQLLEQVSSRMERELIHTYHLDKLGYILDPKEVHGETFRVLKDKEVRLYGEYRTSRLVLAAWDAVNGL